MTQAATVKITNNGGESLLLINSLIGQLAEEVKKASWLRSDQRYDLNAKVIIGTREGPDQFVAKWEAWGGDISNNGIGLLTTRPLEPGRYYYIVMRPKPESRVFAIVMIRRCDKLTADIYKVGTSFVFDECVIESRWSR